MNFYISDTHFWHKKIIEYDDRAFATSEEMNEFIIGKWNSVVAEYDYVYHLGDFAFCSQSNLRKIIDRLNGYIMLTQGNHDYRFHLGSFFDEADMRLIDDGKYKVHLCHYPLESWWNQGRGTIHLHGHSHGQLKNKMKNRYDMCCSLWGYTPVTLEQILNVKGLVDE